MRHFNFQTEVFKLSFGYGIESQRVSRKSHSSLARVLRWRIELDGG